MTKYYRKNILRLTVGDTREVCLSENVEGDFIVLRCLPASKLDELLLAEDAELSNPISD
jgi:hypothetical protein